MGRNKGRRNFNDENKKKAQQEMDIIIELNRYNIHFSDLGNGVFCLEEIMH